MPEHDVGELAGLERADVRREPVRDRRVDRDLREVAQHALVVGRARRRRPRSARIAAAFWKARRTTSPTRPMPCESLESIAITPEVVQQALGGHRRGAHAVAHDRRVAVHAPGREHVHGRHHREVLGLGVDAERHGRRRRGGEDALAPGERERVGPVPAAAALDVEGVPGAAGRDGERVLDREQLVHAVGVHGQLHVVGVGDVERAAQLLGPGADVLVDLEAAAAGAQRRPRPGPGAPRTRARAGRR